MATVPVVTSEPVPPPPRFLTLQQVADELNTSHSQVYALVRDRSLLAVKIGGRGQWRVERVQLEAYITRLYREAEARDPSDLPPDEPDAEH
jgi:excisionase family DNA binding protein